MFIHGRTKVYDNRFKRCILACSIQLGQILIRCFVSPELDHWNFLENLNYNENGAKAEVRRILMTFPYGEE